MTGKPRQRTDSRSAPTDRALRALVALSMVLLALSPLGPAAPADASTVSSAAFTGGTGTVSVGGMLYAKNGGALTLTVTTSSDTKCVQVTGAHTARQTSSTAKASWTFPFTAGTGDGVQTVTAAASPNFNATNCTGQSQNPQSASYILDNTGPVVTAALSPAPNAAGWNNANVTITWSATDAGSGVASGPTPASDSQTANTSTAGVTKTSSAADRLGNSGSGSVTVKLDKMNPTITGSRAPAANANGWNNTDVTVSFTCSDGFSGVKSCTGVTTVSANGANQSVTGTAVDNADNSASTTVAGISIDKVAPTLSGAPTTSPNAAGWYKGNVTIAWSCSDGLSGINGSCPANSTISSEGTGLTASASVTDRAGNTTSATSSPAVKIDKTAPTTTATAPGNWNNNDVTVSLDAADALSGVKATNFTLDGGVQQTGTSVAISAEGVHTLAFWSVDNAGNEEAHHTIQVKIDKTPPTINHSQSPAPNANGWNNTGVTVTFVCADALSGIASCTAAQTVTTEGASQVVTGTAVDNAGNTATDPATVSIDKTAPTIGAAPDRAANGNGWYDADVTVSFTCGDALSGIDSCPASQTLIEGANQSASGTATDAAGNTASAGVAGINVDKTAPSLSGAATTSPNPNGWYSGDVTVQWTAADALSGLDGSAPADSTITGEGNNLSASASISDRAGNNTNATVSSIKIDRTAPSTLASVPAPLDSGWYAGAVQVTLSTGPDLSGVDTTYYSVDGGPAQVYAGPFNHGLKGSHTITFWSVDNAGNVEDKTAPGHSITLKIDGVPPTITGSANTANDNLPYTVTSWTNQDVNVSFDCTDAESGIATCVGNTTVSDETTTDGVSVTGNAQDNAGNTSEATFGPIKIDKTAPTLVGQPTTQANAAGWYKGDVTIAWVGTDGLSGIDPATQPANSAITGEGSSLGAGPVTIKDKAGNSTSASVSGIKIDRTAPTISGAATTSPNPYGWYNGAVTAKFTCSDALSGIPTGGCADDAVLDKDGTGQAVTGQAQDTAGNTASATVSGINIDSTRPQTEINNRCDSTTGWCKNGTVTVWVTARDLPPVGTTVTTSKAKSISYNWSFNGGTTWANASDIAGPVTDGTPVQVTLPTSGSGEALIKFYATDYAANVEQPNYARVKFDNIAPTLTHATTPKANAAGWSNANVGVKFTAVDDDSGSGVNQATFKCGAPDAGGVPVGGTVSADPANAQKFYCDAAWITETTGQAINARVEDVATNPAIDSETVKLDKTVPTITGAVSAGTAGANGWYTSPVTVKFTCADAGAVQSGIATCTGVEGGVNNGVTLLNNGANQSVTGTAEDKADNLATATLSGINIDREKPTITLNGIANGGVYKLGAVPAASCGASDGFSGIDANGCKLNVTGGLANGVGTYNFTATATDKAGNTQTVTGSYRVIYNVAENVAFWLQPINDTAHTVDTTTSVFKAGSTVPAKFQLKDANGKIVQANSAPAWLTPVKGVVTTAPVDEGVYGDLADSGTAFRWSATDQQYIYNWGSPRSGAGNYWRIGVKLDDGQTYIVNIGLR